MPCLRRFVAGLSRQRPWLDPRSIHVEFMVDNMALGHVFLPVIQFSPVSIILQMLHTHFCLRVPLTRRANWQSLGTLTSKALSFIREQWIGKYFHFFQARMCHVSPFPHSIRPRARSSRVLLSWFRPKLMQQQYALCGAAIWPQLYELWDTFQYQLLLPSLARTHNY